MPKTKECFSCFCSVDAHDIDGCKMCRCDVDPTVRSSENNRDCRDCPFYEEHEVDWPGVFRLVDEGTGEARIMTDSPAWKARLAHCSKGYWEGWTNVLARPQAPGPGRPTRNFLLDQATNCADFEYDGSVPLCAFCTQKGTYQRGQWLLCWAHVRDYDCEARLRRLRKGKRTPWDMTRVTDAC